MKICSLEFGRSAREKSCIHNLTYIYIHHKVFCFYKILGWDVNFCVMVFNVSYCMPKDKIYQIVSIVMISLGVLVILCLCSHSHPHSVIE